MTSPTTAPGPGPVSPADADRCPGLLRPHRAADGAVVRIRLIGGLISTAALTAVGAAARRYGDGTVALTSRGNLQLRGLRVDRHGDAETGLVDAITAAGLLPSPTHERVRNILVSPLTGIAGGRADLRPLAGRLDEILCATNELAGLSGRFLFGLDDGRGDLSDQNIDLGAIATDASTARLRIGPWYGPSVPLPEIPSGIIGLARRFLDLSETPWRIADLAGQGRELLRAHQQVEPVRPVNHPRPVGVVERDDGGTAGVVGVPLGRLHPEQLQAIVAVASAGDDTPGGTVVITPDRTVVIPHADTDAARGLGAAGLLVDPADPRHAVTACIGGPGCAKASGPTAGVARAEAVTETLATGLPVHVVACERRCGAPAGAHLELLVTRAGLHRHLRPTGVPTR